MYCDRNIVFYILWVIDDDNNPEIAKRIVKNLSQDREILAVVGHYASDVTLATARSPEQHLASRDTAE